MAIYHFSAQVISRSKGGSSIAAAAYRSCSKITDEATGEIHDYTAKKGNVYSAVFLPEAAPREYADRAVLWNAVEQKEKRVDAQLCREINAALPVEMNLAEWQELVRSFADRAFVSRGMIVHADIHFSPDDEPPNPHVHYMTTMRTVDENGFGKKNRAWNEDDFLLGWRDDWEEEMNLALSKKLDVWNVDKILPATHVSCLSNELRGIESMPQVHIGKVGAHAAEPSVKRTLNDEIKEHNSVWSRLLDEMRELANELKALGLFRAWFAEIGAEDEPIDEIEESHEKTDVSEKTDAPQAFVSREQQPAHTVEPVISTAFAAENRPLPGHDVELDEQRAAHLAAAAAAHAAATPPGAPAQIEQPAENREKSTVSGKIDAPQSTVSREQQPAHTITPPETAAADRRGDPAKTAPEISAPSAHHDEPEKKGFFAERREQKERKKLIEGKERDLSLFISKEISDVENWRTLGSRLHRIVFDDRGKWRLKWLEALEQAKAQIAEIKELGGSTYRFELQIERAEKACEEWKNVHRGEYLLTEAESAARAAIKEKDPPKSLKVMAEWTAGIAAQRAADAAAMKGKPTPPRSNEKEHER